MQRPHRRASHDYSVLGTGRGGAAVPRLGSNGIVYAPRIGGARRFRALMQPAPATWLVGRRSEDICVYFRLRAVGIWSFHHYTSVNFSWCSADAREDLLQKRVWRCECRSTKYADVCQYWNGTRGEVKRWRGNDSGLESAVARPAASTSRW